MDDADRLHLWRGPYHMPRCRVGGRLLCAGRGAVRVVGMLEAPIPWPQARNHGRPFLSVCGGLARAVRTEAAIAVAHWWGVTPLTVWTWRKALGVGAATPGTSRLRRAQALGPAGTAALAKAQAKAQDPGRRAKIAAARRGNPRPRHVIEAMRAATLGRKHTEQTRRRMSEAHRRRGTRPLKAGPARRKRRRSRRGCQSCGRAAGGRAPARQRPLPCQGPLDRPYALWRLGRTCHRPQTQPAVKLSSRGAGGIGGKKIPEIVILASRLLRMSRVEGAVVVQEIRARRCRGPSAAGL
jgi:hypothetical protein